ncbi:MAG: PilZ domain-containing protein [Proteobacteria bacterium]|nr:PilZ domain-containing protein [Pseudomonadota bacterium]
MLSVGGETPVPRRGSAHQGSSIKEKVLTPTHTTQRDKRFETLNLVSLIHRDAEGRVDLEAVGRTLDLSEGGILLEIPDAVPQGNNEVWVTLGIRDHVFEATGQIVHQRRLENGNLAIGISFKDLPAQWSEVIARFLQKTGKE